MKFSIFVLAIVNLIHSLSAQKHDISGRIFNGQPAVRGQFKYMAALELCWISPDNPPDCDFCGGTLIASNWVLTAAHCLEAKNTAYIYLGTVDRDEAESNYIVNENHFISHPAYDTISLQNDIALIQIYAVLECDKIAFVRMPHPATNAVSGDIATTMGWGRMGDEGDPPSRLRWTHVKVISNELCNQYFEEEIGFTRLCVRTHAPYGSPCEGDSGGPLILRDTGELIGISSAVSNTSCEEGTPAVYVRVTSYIPWITRKTGIYF